MTQIYPTYLPFSAAELREHFAEVRSAGDPDRHTRYYVNSAAKGQALLQQQGRLSTGGAAARNHAETYGNQMQKDERFWVATALMSLYRSENRVDLFARLFSRGLPGGSPVDGSWHELLGQPEDLKLYFEVNFPAPAAYRDLLRENAESVVLLPWLRELVRSRSGTRLEGQTKADAVLVNGATAFAAGFQAKVLSDTSTHTRFDPRRNQLARTIDVLLDKHENLAAPLDQRGPKKTFLFLLTPEQFREKRETRLYGLLLPKYQQEPELLRRHLPHRDLEMLDAARQRLGWLTYEDCAAALPGACPWLLPSA